MAQTIKVTWDGLERVADVVAAVMQGTVAAGATDSGAPVKVGGVYNAAPPTLTDGQRGNLQLGARGSLNVTIFGEGGTATPSVNTSQADAVSAATNTMAVASFPKKFNGATWDRDRKPTATSRIVSSAATTNATVAKAVAGDLHHVQGYNSRAAVLYLKIYNKATAPTVGTDVPILTLPLPLSAPFNFNLSGLYFSAGIAYALTTGSADGDTAAVNAGDILGLNLTFA